MGKRKSNLEIAVANMNRMGHVPSEQELNRFGTFKQGVSNAEIALENDLDISPQAMDALMAMVDNTEATNASEAIILLYDAFKKPQSNPMTELLDSKRGKSPKDALKAMFKRANNAEELLEKARKIFNS